MLIFVAFARPYGGDAEFSDDCLGEALDPSNVGSSIRVLACSATITDAERRVGLDCAGDGGWHRPLAQQAIPSLGWDGLDCGALLARSSASGVGRTVHPTSFYGTSAKLNYLNHYDQRLIILHFEWSTGCVRALLMASLSIRMLAVTSLMTDLLELPGTGECRRGCEYRHG